MEHLALGTCAATPEFMETPLEARRLKRVRSSAVAGIVLGAFTFGFAFTSRSTGGRWISFDFAILTLHTCIAAIVYLRASERFFPLMAAVAGAVQTLGLAMSAWIDGGMASPFFGFLLAIPLVFAVLMPEDPGASVSSGVCATASIGTILLLEGTTWTVLGEWLALSACSTYFSISGAAMYRRAKAVESAAEAARVAALMRLAESERRCAEADRLATVGRLAAGVGHEINNPLAFVKANTVFIQREVSRLLVTRSNPEQQEDHAELTEVLGDTLEGISRIQSIVSDLRTFAAGEKLRLDSVAVGTSVDEAARLLRPRLGTVELQFDGLDPRLLVAAEGRRLVQVITNLISNAADALEGHPVRVIRVSTAVDASGVRLVVEDSGPGVAEGNLKRLFEPFFTTKSPRQGTGLGLAISRELIRAMNGELAYTRSTLGGAAFRISLDPANAPEHAVSMGIPPAA